MRQTMLKLEVFETEAADDPPGAIDAQQAAKQQETAFEQGYAAGWQDALVQMRDEDALRRIAAEDALQAVSFSYHEAHAALQHSFVELTSALLDKLLPAVARDALPVRLKAEIAEIAARETLLPLRITCAPDAVATLEPIVNSVSGIQVELVPEPSFSEAQLTLTTGAQERRLDFDMVLENMRTRITDNTACQTERGMKHG